MDAELLSLIPRNEVPEYVCSALGGLVNYNAELSNVHAAWRRTCGRGARVAVLDTGVPVHKDIDVSGWRSFVSGYSQDEQGHATAVGAILAGIGRGGVGISGIAPECDDYYGVVMDSSGAGRVQWIADGIRWAVDDIGADVVNLSLGLPGGLGCDDRLVEACHYADAHGALVVAAAGNDGSSVNCPALVDTVVAVGAVDRRFRRADFSSYGPEVEFAAGGVDVLTAYKDCGYASLSGTSFSAPVISGIAALVASGLRMAGNGVSPEALRERLRALAVDIGPDGRDEYTGYGMPVFRHDPGDRRSVPWYNSVKTAFRRVLEWLRQKGSD